MWQLAEQWWVLLAADIFSLMSLFTLPFLHQGKF